MQQPAFRKHLSPRKREVIIKSLKEKFMMELASGNMVRPQMPVIAEVRDVDEHLRSHEHGMLATHYSSAQKSMRQSASRISGQINAGQKNEQARSNRNMQMSNTLQVAPGGARQMMQPLNFTKLGLNLIN